MCAEEGHRKTVTLRLLVVQHTHQASVHVSAILYRTKEGAVLMGRLLVSRVLLDGIQAAAAAAVAAAAVAAKTSAPVTQQSNRHLYGALWLAV